MHIVNQSSSDPTFETKNGRSWIDLVLTSVSLFSYCRNWEVLSEISCNDHKFLSFTLFQSLTLVAKRLTAKGRFKLYELIEHDSWFESPMEKSAISPEIVKIALDTLYKKWSTWLHRLKRNVKGSNKINPWWSEKPSNMRKKVRAMRRRFQRCNNILRVFYQGEYYSF